MSAMAIFGRPKRNSRQQAATFSRPYLTAEMLYFMLYSGEGALVSIQCCEKVYAPPDILCFAHLLHLNVSVHPDNSNIR